MYHLDEVRPQYKNGGKKPTKEDIKRQATKPKPAESTYSEQVKQIRRDIYNNPNYQRERVLAFRHSIENPNNKGVNPTTGNLAKYYASGESDKFYTIGDGFKLGDNPYIDSILTIRDYITPEEHRIAQEQRYEQDVNAARRYYGDNWDNFPYSTRFVNIDVQYNPGLSGFPQLKRASLRGDVPNIIKQSRRNQKCKPLRRNKTLEDYYLQLLQEEEGLQ